MSTSAISCRQCDHVLAKRHHGGHVTTEVGIRTVVKPDGMVQAICPCGHRQSVYAKSRQKAA